MSKFCRSTFFIILIMVLCSLCLLLNNTFKANIIWHLSCVAFVGYVFAYLLFYRYRYSYYFKKTTKLLTLSFFFSLIGVVLDISQFSLFSNFKYQLNNYFNKSIVVDVDKEFVVPNKTYFIFAFDKTEYKDSPYINKRLYSLYNTYIGYIDKFCGVKIKKNKTVKYREFFKMKLCYDLITHTDINSNNEFNIITIGGKTESIYKGYFNDSSSVAYSINLLLNESIDYETNFKLFWEKINDIVQDHINKYRFTNHVLYAYSDFIHDKNSNIYCELVEIKNSLKLLKSKSIVQNLFIAPYKTMDSKNKKYILDGDDKNLKEETIYVQKIKVENEDIDSKVIDNFKYAKIDLIYSENENSTPHMQFLNPFYKILIYNDKKEFQDVELVNDSTGQSLNLLESVYCLIEPKGNYSIKLSGTPPAGNIMIDINRNKIHLLIEFQSNNNKKIGFIMRLIIIIFIFSLSFKVTLFFAYKYIV